MANALYVKTPLIEAFNIHGKYTAYLKLENTQPSGSFKTRGISFHCQKLKERGCHCLVSSSGGNAGLAVAYTGRKLGLPVTVFVPETTNDHVVQKLNQQGASVIRKGAVWDITNEYSLRFVGEKKEDCAALVHPFNHAEIWKGHSTIIHELKEQMKAPPDAVVLSVGGGGLLCGVAEGLEHVGWSDVPIIACETEGADCFNAAISAGEIISLSKITSVAKSLGALTVAEEAFRWYSHRKIISVKLSDKDAVSACLRFSEDHKMLVEPACGASLVVLYKENILTELVDTKQLKKLESIVVIVCGGHSVNIEQLVKWKQEFNI